MSVWRRKAAWIAVALALSGCAGDSDSPPFEDLPLRDALRLSPEVMASLSKDARLELATRLEEAEHTDDQAFAFDVPEVPTLDHLVDAADAARESANQDAAVLGEISMGESGARFSPHPASTAEAKPDEAPPTVPNVPNMRGKPSETTAPLEDAALRGKAGHTLHELAERAHATHFVRATGLPVGAVVWDQTVYVNASWLIAMEALEKADVLVPPPAPAAPGKLDPPRVQPVSIDFNPYDLPQNLSACATQVRNTCQCGVTQSCDHATTDPTFLTANAECAWVNEAPANAAALCILALLEVDNVRECVQEARPPCTAMPALTRQDAVLFAQSETCVLALDSCLNNGVPLGGSDSCSSCNTCGDCDDCKYCDGKGNDSQECADDCETALVLCEACAKLCDALSASPQAGASATNQCSVRARPGKSPLPAPLGTALWLFAPIAYLLSRRGRRM